MLTVLAGEIHNAQKVISDRANRNPNELIDEQETFGERIADNVASFGGSWTFIILFGVALVSYTHHQQPAKATRAGTRIPTSCSTSSSPCSLPFRRRSS